MPGPDPDPRRDALRAAASEVATQLRQWVEWAEHTGAETMPSEPPAPPAARRQPPARRPSPPPQHEPTRPAPPPTHQRPSRPAPSPGRRAPMAHAPAPGRSGESLSQVRADLGDCTRCGLHGGRTQIVFGVGSERARLVVVGEAPGYYEDMSGEPFVGRAGQLLTRMLAAIGVRREDAYICNVLKCRPPRNRDPGPAEVAACSPFMLRQVRSIGPRVILTAGSFASRAVLNLDESMGRMRGSVRSYHGVPVVATYHPAYLLRNPAAKNKTWQDLLLVRSILRADDAS